MWNMVFETWSTTIDRIGTVVEKDILSFGLLTSSIPQVDQALPLILDPLQKE